MFDLITTAYAESGTSTTAGGGMSSILMIVVMLAIFYFLLIRPENKRKKQAEEMRSSLKKGDWLTTIGGVYGRVVAITDRTVVIEDQRGPRSRGVPEVRYRPGRYPGRAGCRPAASGEEG